MEKSKKIGTIIKVYHAKRDAANNTDKKYDTVILWYRDENGVKRVKYYDRPLVNYYILKDKESPEATHPPLYIEESKLEKITVPSDELFRDIAIRTNCLTYYDKIIQSKGYESEFLKNLHRHPWVYNSDTDLSDYIIKQFYKEYEPDPNYKLHKCYFDIEVDLAPNGLKPNKYGKIGYEGFPEEDEAPCPINIITLIDGKTNDLYTFIARNNLNKSLQDLESHIEEHTEQLINMIKERDNIDIGNKVVNFYNSEEECIEAYFDKLHEIDPDYLLAWNSVFDIKTCCNRLIQLYKGKHELKMRGISAKDAMINTVSDMKYRTFTTASGESILLQPKLFYYADKKKELGKRIDYFTNLDGINYVDQMLYYANLHSAGGKKDSYALDAIGAEEVNRQKLDYKGYTIKTLPWLNAPMFYHYNVLDVVLLKIIEDKLLDFDTIQKLADVTNTRKEKVVSKSISIANFINLYAEKEHYVMNSNKNMVYRGFPKINKDGSIQPQEPDYFKEFLPDDSIPEPTDVYKELFDKKDKYGALVANPLLNEHVGMEIGDSELSMHLFRNTCDLDLSALYPSLIRALNLDASTLVGKFYLYDPMLKQRLKDKFGMEGLFDLSTKDDDSSEVEDEEDEEGNVSKSAGETEDLGPTIVDTLLSQNWEMVGAKYFKLPTISEVYADLQKIIEDKKIK